VDSTSVASFVITSLFILSDGARSAVLLKKPFVVAETTIAQITKGHYSSLPP